MPASTDGKTDGAALKAVAHDGEYEAKAITDYFNSHAMHTIAQSEAA